MKLWQKDIPHDDAASRFATSKDTSLDVILFPYDCEASIAHAKGLHEIGILTDEDLTRLASALKGMRIKALSGAVLMSPDDEDCHSAIERLLTMQLGEVGKKIHTCRSRNDQVLAALRLCYMDNIKSVEDRILEVIAALKRLSNEKGDIAFAGHTHTRKAMPTTVGDWADGYVAALADSLSAVEFVSKLLSSNPLGTGAGYGLPIKTDRELVAREAGFEKVDVNGIYSQLSRTKHEKMLLSAFSSVMFDLNRISADLILFTYPDLGYFILDKSITTGSSIMPQKTNPDVLEIIRGYYSVICGYEVQAASVAHNLISGYHRDMQLSKDAVLAAFDIVGSSLEMMTKSLDSLGVDEKKCAQSLSEEIFLTEKAYELVKNGVAFREAYRQVANDYFKSQK